MADGRSKRPRTPLQARLFDKVTRNPVSGCWEYGGYVLPKSGYGQIGEGGRGAPVLLVHRVSYELFCGPVPDGEMVLHACDNRRCVKPSHLFVGDRFDNAADAVAKGRQAHGETHGRAKVTGEDVLELRWLAVNGYTVKELAAKYRLSEPAVRDIIRRKNWKHLPAALVPGTRD